MIRHFVCQRASKRRGIQIYAGEDATPADVVLVAQTIHPDTDWVWDERVEMIDVKGGTLVTLFERRSE